MVNGSIYPQRPKLIPNYVHEFSNAICHCGQSMKKIVMEHDTYVYCEACFDSFGRLKDDTKCCDNPNRQLAIKRTRTHKRLITQCQSCGDSKGNSIAHGEHNLNEIPEFSYQLEEQMIERRNDQYFEVEREFRLGFFRENKARCEVQKVERYPKAYRDSIKTPEWRRKRLVVLKRDNYQCKCCLNAKATEVHHIVYDNLGNEAYFELVSVCKPCHEKLHCMTKDEYQNEKPRLYSNVLM